MTRVSVTHLVLQYKVYKAMTALLLLLFVLHSRFTKCVTAAKKASQSFTDLKMGQNGPRGTPWGPMAAIPDPPEAREALADLPDNLERLSCSYSRP